MAFEMPLKYGCNPNQKPARVFMETGKDLPIKVLSGKPGYINLLDALNGYQLVRELSAACGMPAAASFKHVSPAGAAIGLELNECLREMYFISKKETLSPMACAYARARGADRMSSFGDFAILSDICDLPTAKLLSREVSDGVMAPGYTDEALKTLTSKRSGAYNVLQIDPTYVPEPLERKMCYGVTFEQGRNDIAITNDMFTNIVTANKAFTEAQIRDLKVALITLKYTQSNSVCYAYDGQAIGVGAGQQSRIHCTRLAGNKADLWQLRASERVRALPFLDTLKRPDRDNAIDIYLSDDYEDVIGEDVWQSTFKTRPAPFTREEKAEYLKTVSGVALGSDAFFPFGDNIERAHKSGVTAIAQPGGSIRDDHVIQICDKYNIAMAFTGARLFHH